MICEANPKKQVRKQQPNPNPARLQLIPTGPLKIFSAAFRPEKREIHALISVGKSTRFSVEFPAAVVRDAALALDILADQGIVPDPMTDAEFRSAIQRAARREARLCEAS
jgi:hypothetical protein